MSKVVPHRRSRLARAGRIGLYAVSAWMLMLFAGVAAHILAELEESSTEVAAHQPAHSGGWGAEALEALSSHAQRLSPIPIANACGLGASSCFRCHNGKRAGAPPSDARIHPWHHEHAKVNYSCAGCHQGNPRILKQDVAHKGLIVNPVAEPAKSCASCHTSGDIQALVARYQSILSAKPSGN